MSNEPTNEPRTASVNGDVGCSANPELNVVGISIRLGADQMRALLALLSDVPAEPPIDSLVTFLSPDDAWKFATGILDAVAKADPELQSLVSVMQAAGKAYLNDCIKFEELSNPALFIEELSNAED